MQTIDTDMRELTAGEVDAVTGGVKVAYLGPIRTLLLFYDDGTVIQATDKSYVVISPNGA